MKLTYGALADFLEEVIIGDDWLGVKWEVVSALARRVEAGRADWLARQLSVPNQSPTTNPYTAVREYTGGTRSQMIWCSHEPHQ